MTDTTSPWHDLDSYIATPRLTGLTLSPDGGSLVVSVQGLDADVTGYTTALWRGGLRHQESHQPVKVRLHCFGQRFGPVDHVFSTLAQGVEILKLRIDRPKLALFDRQLRIAQRPEF